MQTTKRFYCLSWISIAAPGAFAAGPEITSIRAVPDGDTVRVDIELTFLPSPSSAPQAGQAVSS